MQHCRAGNTCNGIGIYSVSTYTNGIFWQISILYDAVSLLLHKYMCIQKPFFTNSGGSEQAITPTQHEAGAPVLVGTLLHIHSVKALKHTIKRPWA